MRVYKLGALRRNTQVGTVEAAGVAGLEKKEEELIGSFTEQWEPMGQQRQRRGQFATETQTSTCIAKDANNILISQNVSR